MESSSWFYADDAGARHGPVTVESLKAAWSDGTIDGLSLVWAESLPEWKPLGEVPELKALLAAADEDEDDDDFDVDDELAQGSSLPTVKDEAERSFYYADPAGAQTGPVVSSAFVSLAAAGQVTASTLVWGPPMTSWEPLNSIPELASLLEGASEGADGANQQAGISDKTKSSASGKGAKATASGAGSKKRKRDKKAKVNAWVYVTGLPSDATEDEIAAHFKKAGLVKLDPVNDKPRVKLYRDAEGTPKGDGSVCFVQEASVELALQLLDGVDLRPGCPLTVEPAQFEKKEGHAGGAAAAGGPRKKRKHELSKEEQAARIKTLQQRMALSWAEEGDETAGLHVVVLKNMFTPEEVAVEGAADELGEDVAEEASKLGEVVKLSVFSKHSDGPIVIRFKSAGAAVEAISLFNGRFFGGRKITCEFWDGQTDFRTREPTDEDTKRLDDFGKWLEEG